MEGCAQLLWFSFLTVIWIQQVSCAKWFGVGSKYLCRCQDDNRCNSTTGTCKDDICMDGWFGPSCQYAQSKFRYKGWSELWEDGGLRGTRCNIDRERYQRNITFQLEQEHPLTWIRIVYHTHRSRHLRMRVDQFAITYFEGNKTIRCGAGQRVQVDEATVDISCPSVVSVKGFNLTREDWWSPCSVLISGGRNVALTPTAKQSADTDSELDVVDSTRRPYCVVAASDGLANAQLTFPTVVDINKVAILNLTDNTEDHMEGFILLWVIKYNNATGNTISTHANLMKKTFVPASTWKNVKKLKIRSEHMEMELCETEVFGDSACDPGKFGRECEHTCNCAEGECFVHSGACPSGCAAGYTGEDCWKVCETGSYGSGCNEMCSEHCGGDSNSCHHITGVCQQGCDPGYRETKCDKVCPKGRYGLRCNETCSEYCGGDKSCDHITGDCVNRVCDPGYTTAKCNTKCPNGNYGAGCREICDAHCGGDNSCDHITGECQHGCDPGYTTAKCSKVTDSTSGQSDHILVLWIIIGVLATLFAVTVTVLLWRCLRQQREDSQIGNVANKGDNSVARSSSSPYLSSAKRSARQAAMQENVIAYEEPHVYEEQYEEFNLYEEINDRYVYPDDPQSNARYEPKPFSGRPGANVLKPFSYEAGTNASKPFNIRPHGHGTSASKPFSYEAGANLPKPSIIRPRVPGISDSKPFCYGPRANISKSSNYGTRAKVSKPSNTRSCEPETNFYEKRIPLSDQPVSAHAPHASEYEVPVPPRQASRNRNKRGTIIYDSMARSAV